MIISNEYVANGCQWRERERSFYKQSIEVSAIRLCSPFSNILYDLLSHDGSTTLHSTGISLMAVTTRLMWPKSNEYGRP
jgi:hypothetical protein